MRLMFWRRPPAIPPVVDQVTTDPEAADQDLSRAADLHQSARAQSEQADAVVSKLVQSRIRNGFAPAIEESIMQKYFRGTA